MNDIDPISLGDRFVYAIEKSFDDDGIRIFAAALRESKSTLSSMDMADEMASRFLQVAPLAEEDIQYFKSTVRHSISSHASNMELINEIEGPMQRLRAAFQEMAIDTANKAAHKYMLLRHGKTRFANDNAPNFFSL